MADTALSEVTRQQAPRPCRAADRDQHTGPEQGVTQVLNEMVTARTTRAWGDRSGFRRDTCWDPLCRRLLSLTMVHLCGRPRASVPPYEVGLTPFDDGHASTGPTGARDVLRRRGRRSSALNLLIKGVTTWGEYCWPMLSVA